MAKRVDNAIADILASENVHVHSNVKGRFLIDGKPFNAYTCRIGKSYRIMYCVRGDCIRFMRVGDHKTVYGKD